MTRRRETALAALLLCGLTILHAWPIGAAPWRASLMWHADAQLNAWILAWYPHALVTDPSHPFDGNIFAPEPNTLAYSEPLLLPALAGAPLIWIGVHPAVVLNVLTVVGLALTACSGWLVARRWTGSPGAAIVGGALVAFNVHLLTRIPHLAAVHAWGLPLTLYYAEGIVERPTRRGVLGLGVLIAAIAATSLYWLALSGIIAATVVVAGARTRRAWGAAIAAALLGLLLAAPVLVPYARLAASGSVRSIDNAREFSATPAGYLTSTSLVHQRWSAPVTSDVDVWFAGVMALALAAAGVARAAGARGDDRRRLITLVVVSGVGVVLSLGPATAVYRWLYDWFPPMQGLRAAARFGFLYLLAVAIAAAYGVAAIEARWDRHGHARVRRVAVPALLLLAVTVEAWHGPVRSEPLQPRPAIYRLLADEPDPVTLVEVPFYPAHAAFENGEYVLNATTHFRPLMNGYSGFTPMSYRRRADSFWFFPREFAIEAIRREGATHVMVHLRRFGDEAKTVDAALQGRGDLELVAADRDGRRLYRIR